MKAMVLAGGFPQIALLQELKSHGITTILLDWNKEPVAKKYADIYYQESTTDLEAIERIAIEEKVDFILTVCSESAIKSVAKVSQKLNLPCYVTEDMINKVTDKAYMKKVFAQWGIPNAKHMILQKEEEVSADEFEFPVIVKPTDCYGSSGVRKVMDSELFYEAIKDAKAMSKSGVVLIEEFLDGVELSIDAFVVDGKARVLCVTRSDKIADDDRFVIYRGSYPAMDDIDSVMNEIEDIVQKIASAFEMTTTPLLVQMIRTKNKLGVLEFSTRTGGSAKYMLAKKSCGFDLVKGAVDITLGIKPNFDGIKGENKYVTNEYLYCRPGVFDRLDGFEEMKKQGVISEYYQFKWRNAEAAESITKSGDRMAGFTIQADTKEEMNRKHKTALKNIRILDINGDDMLRRDLIGELYTE
ncbi:MAG: ATP-grasp domain-containing protein [Clostridia bacterium]|nr:ATP-grasp domain-containing protein [Clostridia bacterium]